MMDFTNVSNDLLTDNSQLYVMYFDQRYIFCQIRIRYQSANTLVKIFIGFVCYLIIDG